MNALAFGLLAYMLAKGEISAAEFVFYIGLVSGFSRYFEEMLRQIMSFNNTSASISYMREFLETRDGWNRGEGVGAKKLEQISHAPVKLELRNVSFTYPGSETAALKNINMVIRPGEKIALIGLNGAGKTTLVKLMCGFYHPTEGEILLNDIPIQNFNREEYYSLVFVLFQDSTMLALTLDENLAGRDPKEIDQRRLKSALELSGFDTVYEKTAGRGEALLVREINKNSVDFSGGEKQKMLFARTLYQDTPLVILDEPTAALDPESESEVFAGFDTMVGRKTAIYISHRLASCRFCQDILVFDGGKVVQRGRHEELESQEGLYKELWDAQAQYYA